MTHSPTSSHACSLSLSTHGGSLGYRWRVRWRADRHEPRRTNRSSSVFRPLVAPSFGALLAFASSALLADLALSLDAHAAEGEPVSVQIGMDRPCRGKIPEDVLARANNHLVRTTNRDYARERYRFVAGSSTVLRAGSCSGEGVSYQLSYEYAPLRVVGAMPDQVYVQVPFDSAADIVGLVGFKAEDGTVVEPTITRDGALDIAKSLHLRFAELQSGHAYLALTDGKRGMAPWTWEVELCRHDASFYSCVREVAVKVDAATGAVFDVDEFTPCPPPPTGIDEKRAIEIARDHDPRFADLSNVSIQPTEEDELVSDDDPCPKRNRNWQVTLCNEGREGERCSISASLKVNGTTGEVVAPWP